MTCRVIASGVLIVSLLAAWAAPAAADEPARGKAEELARQARSVNRWLREHPEMAEKIIRGLRGSRAPEARQPARRQPAAPAPRRAPAPPAAARTHVWSGWVQIPQRPDPQRRLGTMMPGQRLGQRGGMMFPRGRGRGMGGQGGMMRGRGRGMGRGGMMMRGRGRGLGMGRRGPAVCPYCGRPMGPGTHPQINRRALRPEARRPDLWRSRARTARPLIRERILAGIGEHLRQRIRERAAARGRDMDRPRGDRPEARRRGPRDRGDRPSPEAARRDRREAARRRMEVRPDRPEAARRGPPERGERRSPEARRGRANARDRGDRSSPEAASRGRGERGRREGGDRPAGQARRDRPEGERRERAERAEPRGDELAAMAKAIERLEQQVKRLAQRLDFVERKTKYDMDRLRGGSNRPR